MFCPYCGREIGNTDSFCSNCGSSLSAVCNQPVTSLNKLSEGIRSAGSVIPNIASGSLKLFNTTLSAKVIMSSVVAAIVIAGIILYNMFFVVHPSDTVNRFINAINDSDYNTLVSCLDPKIEKFYNAAGNIVGGLTGVKVQDVMDLFPALASHAGSQGEVEVLQFKNPEIVSEKIFGDTAYVTVKSEITGGNSSGIKPGMYRLIFVMKKFNEGWRVTDIKEADS